MVNLDITGSVGMICVCLLRRPPEAIRASSPFAQSRTNGSSVPSGLQSVIKSVSRDLYTAEKSIVGTPESLVEKMNTPKGAYYFPLKLCFEAAVENPLLGKGKSTHMTSGIDSLSNWNSF